MSRQTQNNSDNLAVQIAGMVADVGYIKDEVKDIKTQMSSAYVTKNELELVKQDVGLIKKIVFGFISVILLGFVGAAVTFFINGGNQP